MQTLLIAKVYFGAFLTLAGKWISQSGLCDPNAAQTRAQKAARKSRNSTPRVFGINVLAPPPR
jgi:hypothetical protein